MSRALDVPTVAWCRVAESQVAYGAFAIQCDGGICREVDGAEIGGGVRALRDRVRRRLELGGDDN